MNIPVSSQEYRIHAGFAVSELEHRLVDEVHIYSFSHRAFGLELEPCNYAGKVADQSEKWCVHPHFYVTGIMETITFTFIYVKIGLILSTSLKFPKHLTFSETISKSKISTLRN